jgi:hypothetical protein
MLIIARQNEFKQLHAFILVTPSFTATEKIYPRFYLTFKKENAGIQAYSYQQGFLYTNTEL